MDNQLELDQVINWRSSDNKPLSYLKLFWFTGALHLVVFTRGHFWPSGIDFACVCPSLRQSVRPSVTMFVLAITHYPFKLGSPNLGHRCKSPLLFMGLIALTFKVKFNFKVKIYPSLSLWVAPRHKSPQIIVRISKFGPTMHFSTVKVPIDFGIDWASSSVLFSISNLLFSTTLCISYSFASVCIQWDHRQWMLHIPHGTAHIWILMHAGRVAPWTMTQPSFISWWDHRRSMSHRLGDWHWILQAPIGFRQIIHTSHAVNFECQQSTITETIVR